MSCIFFSFSPSLCLSFTLFHAQYPCAAAAFIPLLPFLHLCALQSQCFREQKYTNHLFIHSALSCLFLVCRASRKLFVTGDSPSDFTRGLCWAPLIHTLAALSEVNALAALPCKYRAAALESVKSFLPSMVACLAWSSCRRGPRWQILPLHRLELLPGSQLPHSLQPPSCCPHPEACTQLHFPSCRLSFPSCFPLACISIILSSARFWARAHDETVVSCVFSSG